MEDPVELMKELLAYVVFMTDAGATEEEETLIKKTAGWLHDEGHMTKDDIAAEFGIPEDFVGA